MASYFSSQVFSYQPGKNLNADMDMNIHSWQVFLSKHSHTCINTHTHSRSDVSTAVLIIQPYIYAGLLLPSTSSHTWSAASLYVESIWSLLRWCLRFLIFHHLYFFYRASLCFLPGSLSLRFVLAPAAFCLVRLSRKLCWYSSAPRNCRQFDQSFLLILASH